MEPLVSDTARVNAICEYTDKHNDLFLFYYTNSCAIIRENDLILFTIASIRHCLQSEI